MKMIVGLGNPGKEYEKTRHNVGFIVLERLFKRMTNDQSSMTNNDSNVRFHYKKNFDAELVQVNSMLLVKPKTFMNKSGVAVAKVVSFYKLEPKQVCVVHDDLDLALGTYKIHFGKGPKIHNGMNSVEEALGTKEFWRVRIGTDNRLPMTDDGRQVSGEEYVLQSFLADEKVTVEKVIDEVAQKLMKGWEGYV